MANPFKALVPRKGEPRSKVTGTSYKSSGQTDLQLTPQDYNEVGSSGKSTLFESVPELSSRVIAQQTYTKMYRNSVSVRIGIRAAEAPVVGGDYFVEPYSDDPQDLLIAEFVEFNLFEASTIPFKSTQRTITNGKYRAGFKVMEKVWELREWAPRKTSPGANRKQYTVLRKLAPRPSDTIQEITYDANGGPTGVVQNALNPLDKSSNIVTIPIEKLAIFPFEEEDGDLFGNSILRPAFMHYTFLEPLYKIDGIQKEHHGIGIPDVKLHGNYTDADKKLAHVIGRNLRTNEHSYVVSNDRFDVNYIEMKGQMVDALKSAEFHDTMILKSILLQFINMGVIEVGGGGRATGATHLDMFLKAMRYVAESNCDGYNHYIIPQIVAFNFNTDRFPRLRVRNIGETKDLQMWAAAMSNLVGRGAIAVDEDTENFIRDQVDFPRRTTPRPVVVTNTVEDIYNQIPPDQQAIVDKVNGNGHGNPAAVPTPGKIQTGNIGKSASSGQ